MCVLEASDPGVAGGDQHEAGGDDDLVADADGQHGAQAGSDGQGQGDRKDADAGFEGGVAAHDLEVQDDQEQKSRQREERQGDRAAGGGEPRVGEQAYVEHRMGLAALDDHQCADCGRSDREADQGAGAAPAVSRGFDDRVDQGGQCDQRGAQAAQVERVVDPGPVRAG